MVARQDTPDQQRRKLEKGASSLTYGLLFNYKSQRFGLPSLSLQSPAGIMPPGVGSPVELVKRDASAGTLDLFVRWVSKKFELEAEAVGIYGSIGNVSWDPAATAVSATIRQAAGVLRGKAKLGDAGRFAVGGEFGIASGDEAPGFGNFPGRCNLSLPPIGRAARPNHRARDHQRPPTCAGWRCSAFPTTSASASTSPPRRPSIVGRKMRSKRCCRDSILPS